MEAVTLRPHHLVRGVERYLEYDQGLNGGHRPPPTDDGYGEQFHRLEHSTLRAIIDRPDLPVNITDSWDDFCFACGRRSGCGYERETPADIKRVTELGLAPGQTVSSGDLVARISRRRELIACVVEEIVSGSELGKYLRSIYHQLF